MNFFIDQMKGGSVIPSNQGYIATNAGKKYLKDQLNAFKALDNAGKVKIILIIVLILFVISFIIYYLTKNSTRQLKKQINGGNTSRFYKDSRDGSSPNFIQPVKVNQLPEGNSSTWCFWININNWYYRYELWKNICIKGSLVKPEDELAWDSVGKQCPGIWMTPNQNNIRTVFTTRRLNKNNELKDYLEYCQINDIPIGVWSHISIVMINKTIAIYLNGELVRTCIFKGQPEFNNGPLQVSYSGGFNGQLKNFRYIGKRLSPEYIRQLYELGPNEKGNYFWKNNVNIPKISFGCDN